jgi:hypothetical protein
MIEPNRQYADILRSYMKALFHKTKLGYELSTFFSYKEALKTLESDFVKHDVFIISLTETESARVISKTVRYLGNASSIIFSGSCYDDLNGFLSFRPSAMLLHGSPPNTAVQTIYTVHQEALNVKKTFNTKYFLIRSRDEVIRIPHTHIDYIESLNRKVFLYNNNNKKTYEFYSKLDDVAASLDDTGFVRCHQSCIVNMSNVQRLDKSGKMFHMLSGKTVDISKRSLKEVITYFEEYNLLKTKGGNIK